VTGGRDIAPLINSLLELPFVVKAATKDWHPQDHVSFASNHPPPDNIPFESFITIANPLNGSETETTRLWPNHCVQNSPGAELIPELDVGKVDEVIEKGMDKRVEMYSVFHDPFKYPTVYRSRIADVLRAKNVTDVFVVGLAYDYCVKYTAIDSVGEGFTTYLVEDASKAVDPTAIPQVNEDVGNAGVKVVRSDGPEIQKVKQGNC
jgi:nicotinamidase-related amidase